MVERSHHIIDVGVIDCTISVDGVVVLLAPRPFRLFACLALSQPRPWKISRLAAVLYPNVSSAVATSNVHEDLSDLHAAHPLLRDALPNENTLYLPSTSGLFRVESLISRLETLIQRIRSGDESYETATAILAAIVQGVQFVLPGITESWAGSVRMRVERLRQDAMLFALQVSPAQADAFNSQLITASRGTSVVAGVPGYRNYLFGRSADLAALREILQRERIITLIGEAGVGKTALASHAQENLPARLQGQRIVSLELRGVSSYQVVLSALLQHLGLSVALSTLRDDADLEKLIRGLLGSGMLLADNAEGLEPRAIGLLASLARHATLLITSQKPLSIPGEYLFEVEPLAVPGIEEGEEATTADLLERYPAAALLALRRWEAKSPPLTPATLAHTVRSTQGVPLAIEIVSRQENLIHLLASGVQSDPLEAAMDSLSEEEMSHLFRLSLWRSGIPSEATDPAIVAQLVESALLIPGGTDFYRLPVPVQTWARRQLSNLGAVHQREMKDNHLDALESLPDDRLPLLTLDIEAACSELEHARAARLVTRATVPLRLSGRPYEALRLLECVPEGSLVDIELAELLDAKGRSLLLLGRWREARQKLECALPIWRALAKRRETARCLSGLATALDELEIAQDAIPLYEEAAKIFVEIKDFKSSGALYANLGASQILLCRYHEALETFKISADLTRAHQPQSLGRRLLGQAEAMVLLGDKEVISVLREALESMASGPFESQRARAILLWSIAEPDRPGIGEMAAQALRWHTQRGLSFNLTANSEIMLQRLHGNMSWLHEVSSQDIDEIIAQLLYLKSPS